MTFTWPFLFRPHISSPLTPFSPFYVDVIIAQTQSKQPAETQSIQIVTTHVEAHCMRFRRMIPTNNRGPTTFNTLETKWSVYLLTFDTSLRSFATLKLNSSKYNTEYQFESFAYIIYWC